MRPATLLKVLTIAAMTLFNAEARAAATSGEDRAPAQSLYVEGMRLLESDSLGRGRGGNSGPLSRLTGNMRPRTSVWATRI